RAGVVIDLAPPADGDRPAEVGRDAAAGAVVRVAVDLAAVGDRHAAEADHDAAAVHPNRVVVADLAGGDVDVTPRLRRNPPAPETPRPGVDRGGGRLPVDRPPTDDRDGPGAGPRDVAHPNTADVPGRVAIDVAAAIDRHGAGGHRDAAALAVGGLVVTDGAT